MEDGKESSLLSFVAEEARATAPNRYSLCRVTIEFWRESLRERLFGIIIRPFASPGSFLPASSAPSTGFASTCLRFSRPYRGRAATIHVESYSGRRDRERDSSSGIFPSEVQLTGCHRSRFYAWVLSILDTPRVRLFGTKESTVSLYRTIGTIFEFFGSRLIYG